MRARTTTTDRDGPDRLDNGHWDQNGYGDHQGDGYESIGRSALHHPFLVGVMAVIGLLVGTAIGYEHNATYTADAQLIVGQASDLAQDQIPGLAVAEEQLASDYARLGNSTDVIAAAEANLHLSYLPGTLSASPIAESSIIDVQATASSEAEALKLANAGAAALETVVIKVNNDNQAELAPIVNAYEKADAAAEQATLQETCSNTSSTPSLASWATTQSPRQTKNTRTTSTPRSRLPRRGEI